MFEYNMYHLKQTSFFFIFIGKRCEYCLFKTLTEVAKKTIRLLKKCKVPWNRVDFICQKDRCNFGSYRFVFQGLIEFYFTKRILIEKTRGLMVYVSLLVVEKSPSIP